MASQDNGGDQGYGLGHVAVPPEQDVSRVLPPPPRPVGEAPDEQAGQADGDVVDEAEDVMKEPKMDMFERFLSVWVALCIVLGVLIGRYLPGVVAALDTATLYQINIPIAVLLWVMILPMILHIDFASVRQAVKRPSSFLVTTVTNWLIKPFTMFAICYAFLLGVYAPIMDESDARQYLAGCVLLGAAPCTAMVFVWSSLAKADGSYTLIQVALNDLILLVAFAPIVKLLIGLSDLTVPWGTVLVATVLFVIVPVVGGALLRHAILASAGLPWLEKRLLPALKAPTIIALLSTLVLIFAFQANKVINAPLDILLIAVPLTIQTMLIFILAYGASWLLAMPHSIAAPAGFIGASNFFELSVALAIALFGHDSGATLATVVGVLVEVPVMLSLVAIARGTRRWFPRLAGRRRVLVLGTGNSCRSQIAELVINHVCSDQWVAISAGVTPARRVNPNAVVAVRDLGVVVGDVKPRSFSTVIPKTKLDAIVLLDSMMEAPQELQEYLLDSDARVIEFPLPQLLQMNGKPPSLQETRACRDRLLTDLIPLLDQTASAAAAASTLVSLSPRAASAAMADAPPSPPTTTAARLDAPPAAAATTCSCCASAAPASLGKDVPPRPCVSLQLRVQAGGGGYVTVDLAVAMQ